jgi:hypothetical protein
MKEDEELEGMNIVSADIFFCSFCLYVNHVKTPKWGKDRWCVSDETVAQATIRDGRQTSYDILNVFLIRILFIEN